MGKRILRALLVAATILAVATTPLISPTISTTHQTQATLITRNSAATPPQTQWDKTYSGTKDDSVKQTSHSGYIVAGVTDSSVAGAYDFWAPKRKDSTPPSAISDLAAGSPTNNSITLTWTAPGDDGMTSNATGYILKHSTTGLITAENWTSAATYTQSWIPAKNGTTEIHVVTGLNNATKYWFAVKAYDDANPINYGNISNSPSSTTNTNTGTTGDTTLTIIAVGGVAAVALVVMAVAVIMKTRKKPN